MLTQNITLSPKSITASDFQRKNDIPTITENNIGRVIGSGGEGAVCEDANDPTSLIKIFEDSAVHAQENIANVVDTFNRYYGSDQAYLVSYCGKDCIKMPKLPGVTLGQLYFSDFPDKQRALESFNSMLEALSRKNIRHSDFHSDNILYDICTNTFYPIDMFDETEVYNKMSPSEQESSDKRLNDRINACKYIVTDRKNEIQEARDHEIKEMRAMRALRQQANVIMKRHKQ